MDGHVDMRATPEHVDRDAGFAYEKGSMAAWLLATGLMPDQAWDVARRVDDHLATTGRRRVSLVQLHVLARGVLGAEDGDMVADRFRRWHDFMALGRPLVVLIGGGTGVGKSSVATQLAYHLAITRVESTDVIRQVLRSVIPDAIAPELSRSSFELDQGPPTNDALLHAEFQRQAQQVLVGVRATIDRAVREGTPVILEGIHLFPGLVDARAVADALVVPVVLNVGDRSAHAHRFELRAEDSERAAQRYEDGLEAIRLLQDHVVATAQRAGVPVIENRRLHSTVRGVLDVIFAAVDGALAQPRPATR